jgi:hypothetical protein
MWIRRKGHYRMLRTEARKITFYLEVTENHCGHSALYTCRWLENKNYLLFTLWPSIGIRILFHKPAVHHLSLISGRKRRWENLVGFEVLTAVSMKIAVFWVTLVNFYQTTRCYNPEDSNLHERTWLHSTDLFKQVRNVLNLHLFEYGEVP